MVNAIIVAAGKGVRMGTELRKQYLVAAGRPILSHTLHKFDVCTAIDKIYLVIPRHDFAYCQQKVLPAACLNNPVQLVDGATKRQQSVFRGLESLEEKEGLVAVHDGVRPLIDPSIIETCVRVAAENGACIPGIPVSDTIKKANRQGIITSTVERSGLWSIQTPQVFEYRIIIEAHQRAIHEGFTGTDDASLVERLGYPVSIINGSKTNIKITTEEDLAIASKLLVQ